MSKDDKLLKMHRRIVALEDRCERLYSAMTWLTNADIDRKDLSLNILLELGITEGNIPRIGEDW